MYFRYLNENGCRTTDDGGFFKAVSIFSIDLEMVVKAQFKTRNCLYVREPCFLLRPWLPLRAA